MKKIHLMKKMKSCLTWLCVVSLVIGLFAGAGPIVKVKAADTAADESADEFVREWTVYEAADGEAGLIVSGTFTDRDGVTGYHTSNYIDDAGVELPDGLTESNLTLQVKLNVSAEDDADVDELVERLNLVGEPAEGEAKRGNAWFELCNELNDCGELSWNYTNFVAGDNTISFAFKDAERTNHTPVNGKVVQDGKTPFDWQETIDYFRFHQQIESGLKITISEIKIVYTDHGLVFGDTDTHLKLENAMSETPSAVEATVKMTGADTWTVHSGRNFSGISMVVEYYTTTDDDPQGAGMECIILDASGGAIDGFEALETNMAIDTGDYTLDELSLCFWVHSNTAGNLSLDDKGESQIRISTNEADVETSFLYWNMMSIPVNDGWTYVELPLDQFGQSGFVLEADGTVPTLNTWKICCFDVAQDKIIRFGDFMLVATDKDATIGGETPWIMCDSNTTFDNAGGLKYEQGSVVSDGEPGAGTTYAQVNVSAYDTLEWTLRAGNDISTNGNSAITSGTTDNQSPLGEGVNYMVLDATNASTYNTFSTFNNDFCINGSAYGKEKLAVEFWIYANEAGPLAWVQEQNNSQIRLTSGSSLGVNFIYYPLDGKTVDKGWNHIVLPLDEFNTVEGVEFNINNICGVGFTPLYINAGHYRYISEITLKVLEDEGTVWALTDTGKAIDNSNCSSAYTDILFSSQGYNVSAYAESNLAVEFMVYSNEDGRLSEGDDDQLRISSHTEGKNLDFRYYSINGLEVKKGWNTISLRLDQWNIPPEDPCGKIDLSAVRRIGLPNFVLDAGSYRYISEMKLVVLSEKPDNKGKFGFDLTLSEAINAGTDGTNYGVGFWFYSSTGLIPTGQIELGSSGKVDDANEIRWYPQSLGIQPGWNYITLRLAEPPEKSGTIDYSSINYMRWYSDGKTGVSQDTVLAITDLELIKLDTKEKVQTICKAEDQPLWYGLSKTVYTMKEGPETTTNYWQTTVPAYRGGAPAKSGFGFFTPYTALDMSAYDASDLNVSFWVYTANGKLPNGQIEINSSGTPNDSAELVWFPQNFNSELQIGWNKLTLNLGAPHHTGGTGIDLSNINYIRWYTDANAAVLSDTMFRIGDIILYSPCVDEGDVLVGQNVTEISDNRVIFANTGIAGEENPFAFFVTANGYPAVLYGTTLFALEKNICTGAYVKLKVARNSSGAIEFYVNGELAGTSKTTVSALGAPVNEYRIGADGAGNQVLSGVIRDVKTYSDASATICTGNWPLIGDIKFVTEVMPDVSGNENHASFAGTLAEQWYTVEPTNADKAEWSLVYIPEACQRMYAGGNFGHSDQATFYKSTSWIAKDVTELKQQNIKYVVGDKTADSGQLDAINHGYSMYDTSVANSNLNDNEHSYYRLQAGDGVKWMILTLNLDAGDAYTYAQEIMEKYPSDNVIVATDVYKKAIYETLGNRVKLIISGGKADDNESTDGVPAMVLPALNDIEQQTFGGEEELGLLYVLRFTENGTKVTARSYSPKCGKFYDDDITRNGGTLSLKLEEKLETKAIQFSSATGGTEPSSVPEGYKFAGWYEVYNEDLEHGLAYSIYDASVEAQTFKTENYGLNIKPTAYSVEQLAVEFWVYASETGKMANGDNHLRISSSTDGIGANWLYWPVQDISVERGWNHISLPLSQWKQGTGGEFDKDNIQRIGFEPLLLPAGTYRYITDIELVAYVDDEVSRKWTLRSGSDTTTKSGQTLETGKTSTFEKALAKGTTGSNVYAKFVDADVLGVKAQVKVDADDKTNYTDIRFLTSTDSLNYKEIGFDVTLTNPYSDVTSTKSHQSTYVYEKILAMTEEKEALSYTADQIFSTESTYFKAFTIRNVPNWAFSEEFTVQPYWITLDGTTVYGDEVDKSVWMGYPTNYEYLPKIVETTYETEDVVIAEIIPTIEKYGYLDYVTEDGDWTAAIQKALNDCHDMGGGTVYLPAGTYKISDSLDIPAYVTLRGDYNDPDKTEGAITDYGTVFDIYPTVQVSANRNDDSAHNKTASFIMHGSSGIVGVTAYYPEQEIGEVIEYPYTFYIQNNGVDNQLITLKDITVINGYRGVGTSYKMQHEALIIDNFKGTFIDCGLALYNSSDTGRVTGVTISRKYWAAKDDVGEEEVDLAAVGMELGDLEWDLFSDCTINGCTTAISIVGGWRANFAGSMIDMTISDCTTGITVADKNDDVYTYDPEKSGKNTYPLNWALDPRWGMVIARSSISASENAIENNTNTDSSIADSGNYLSGTKYYSMVKQTSALVRLTDVEYAGNIKQQKYSGYEKSKTGLLGKEVAGSYTYNVMGEEKDSADYSMDLSTYKSQYDTTYTVTTAQKKNLWVLDLEEYDGTGEDVSGLINDAMTDVLKRNSEGGILYIPGGTYSLDAPIEVAQGVELRGASGVATREQFQNSEGTLFMCYYGDDSSSSTTDTALITLAGDNSGVNGVKFLYPQNVITYDTDTNSTYTIAATGENVHVVNTYIAASSYGLNLENCNNFYVEGLYTCCYLNAINTSDSSGIIRGCAQNPNMITRTKAKGITDNWPVETEYNSSAEDYPIIQIRNNLMTNLKYITISGEEEKHTVLVQDVIAYALNTLITNNGATVTAINTNADAMDSSGYQFNLQSGNLTVINALRAAISQDNGSALAATLYNSDFTGNLQVYNSMMAKTDAEASAYEENFVN